jgi:hypothetical protein
MLGLRMLHLDRDQRLAAPGPVDPIVVTKNPQRLGDRFIETVGAHLDCVLDSAKVNARNSAGLQGHFSQLSYSLFIRYHGHGERAMFLQAPCRFLSLSSIPIKSIIRLGPGGVERLAYFVGD